MTVQRIKFLILSGALLIGVPFFVHTTTYGWQWDWRSDKPLSPAQQRSADRIRLSVQTLAGEIGTRDYVRPLNLASAADYIEGRLHRLGYGTVRQGYRVGDQDFYNIIADFPNAPADGPTLIVAAHYDSHGNPGADDNASGVAVLLELAEMLREQSFALRVRFAAFVNEEPPFFMTERMGSHLYARTARKNEEDIRGVIVLETVGYYTQRPFSQRYLAFMGPFYPNQGDFVAVIGNFTSAKLAGRVHSAMRRSRFIRVEKLVAPEFVPGVYYSDHWSFWQHDYPAVMLTDTAFLRNPNYHRATDTPDTLDYAALARLAWAVREAVIAVEDGQR